LGKIRLKRNGNLYNKPGGWDKEKSLANAKLIEVYVLKQSKPIAAN